MDEVILTKKFDSMYAFMCSVWLRGGVREEKKGLGICGYFNFINYFYPDWQTITCGEMKFIKCNNLVESLMYKPQEHMVLF